MTVNVISLSYPIDSKTPTHGKSPKPRIKPHTSKSAGGTSSTYIVTVHNHTGTHVDAPAHFVPNGRRISEYSTGELTFLKPALIEMPKAPGEWVEEEDVKKVRLRNADCLLIRTGFGAFRNKDVYRTNNPGISPKAILWLRREMKNIRCIGIDSISISGFQDRPRGRRAHLAAFEMRDGLGEPLLLIEDMNLAVLKSGAKIQKIMIVPWFISDIDSAPCTVLAEVKR